METQAGPQWRWAMQAAQGGPSVAGDSCKGWQSRSTRDGAPGISVGGCPSRCSLKDFTLPALTCPALHPSTWLHVGSDKDRWLWSSLRHMEVPAQAGDSM